MRKFSYIILLILASLLLGSCSVLPKEKEPQTDAKKKFEFDYYFLNGQKEKLLGNYELAAQFFQECIKLNPKEPQPFFENATIFDIASQPELALKYAKEAYRLNPENYYYATFLSQLYQESEQFNEAIDVLSKLKKSNPERLEIYFALAHNYILKGDYKTAIETYNEIEKKTGISEQVSMQKQRLYTELNEWDKAEDEIKRLIKHLPDNPKYYGLLADLYAAQGKENEALKTYREILKKYPEDPYIHLSLADYYRQKQMPDSSFSHLELAFYNPDLDIDTKMQILLSFYTLSENDEKYKEKAYQLIKITKDVHPKEAKIHTVEGDFLYRDGKLKEALSAYKIAVQLEPDHFDIWSQITLIEAELKLYKQVMEDAEKAIELFPNQPTLYYLYGAAAYQLKEYQKAIDYLEIGKELVINNNTLLSQFYGTLGDAYYALGNKEKAYKNYDKALQYLPDNVYVLNNYAYYLSLDNTRLEKAKEMAAFANQLEPNKPSFEDTYGWILYQLKDYKGAEEWIKRAIENGASKNGVILEHYGDVQYQLGNIDKALEYWQKAKETGKASQNIELKIKNKKIID
jgi:tetratricopeptide (TPR) repeat protein